MSEAKRDPRDAVSDVVERAYAVLDQVDYYELLGQTREASMRDLREAYYRLASQLHPDLHGEWMNAEQRRKLTSVFSRVVEAYKILTSDQRRALYDAALTQGQLRWDADAAARPKVKREEDDVPDGPARKFFLLGRDALRAGNVKGAVMNLRMALSMDRNNGLIKRVLDEAQALAAPAEKDEKGTR